MPNKIDLIRQALNAAESSIKLARQLMNDLDHSGPAPKGKPQMEKRPEHEQIPGVVGVFDGENMTTDKGEKVTIPANYAAKSQIVVGDTLKMIEVEGEKRFKQVERVKRVKTTGVLTRKEGKYTVVAEEGRFRVLQNAVEHLGAKVGDEIMILVPEGNPNAGWAAAVSLPKPAEDAPAKPAEVKSAEAPKQDKPAEQVAADAVEKPKPETKKVEVKEEPKPIKEKESTPEVSAPAEVAPEVVAEAPSAENSEIPVEVAEDMNETLDEIASKTATSEEVMTPSLDSASAPADQQAPAKKDTASSPIAPKAGEEVLVTDEDLM